MGMFSAAASSIKANGPTMVSTIRLKCLRMLQVRKFAVRLE